LGENAGVLLAFLLLLGRLSTQPPIPPLNRYIFLSLHFLSFLLVDNDNAWHRAVTWAGTLFVGWRQARLYSLHIYALSAWSGGSREARRRRRRAAGGYLLFETPVGCADLLRVKHIATLRRTEGLFSAFSCGYSATSAMVVSGLGGAFGINLVCTFCGVVATAAVRTAGLQMFGKEAACWRVCRRTCAAINAAPFMYETQSGTLAWNGPGWRRDGIAQ